MIEFKHKSIVFTKVFTDESEAQHFANVLRRNKQLKNYEFISEKFKLDYKDGIIRGKSNRGSNKKSKESGSNK